MAVVKCKPWGKDQGDYVLVDAAELVEGFHQLLEDPGTPSHESARKREKPGKVSDGPDR